MPDMENVVKAIDICLRHGGCNDCPYCFSKKGYATIKCCDDMFRDILALLKEQEDKIRQLRLALQILNGNGIKVDTKGR